VPTAGGVVADAVAKGALGAALRRPQADWAAAEGDHGGGSQAGADRVSLDGRYGEAYVEQTEKEYAAEVRKDVRRSSWHDGPRRWATESKKVRATVELRHRGVWNRL
jgi:hypothetical protein